MDGTGQQLLASLGGIFVNFNGFMSVGSKMVFATYEYVGGSPPYVYDTLSVNLDGTGEISIDSEATPGGFVPSFKDDTNNLVYGIYYGPNAGIVKLDTTGVANTSFITPSFVSGGSVSQIEYYTEKNKIVYIADKDVDNDYELFVVDFDGSNSLELSGTIVTNGDVDEFIVNKSNDTVIFLADKDTDGAQELYSVKLDGTGLIKISGTTLPGSVITNFQLTNDNSKICFIADRLVLLRSELFCSNVDGSGLYKVNLDFEDVGGVKSFKMVPDSSGLVFLANQQDYLTYEVFKHRFSTAKTERVFDKLAVGMTTTYFDITPDSKNVFLESNIWEKSTDLHIFVRPLWQ